jgi:hypothetical protein
MTGKPSLPADLQNLVEDLGRPVTSKDVDVWEKVRDVQDRSYRLRTIVRAWDRQQTQDRQMRERYATWLMIALAVQAGCINVVCILLGAGVLHLEPWTARTFIMSVFAEIAALVLIVVKYLFTPTSDKILQLTGRTANLPRRPPTARSKRGRTK